MRKSLPKVRTCPPVPALPKKLRVLKKCLRELKALYIEATAILKDLLANPSADIVRNLCARFHILQEYFVLRYQEARAYAISVLGHFESTLSFP